MISRLGTGISKSFSYCVASSNWLLSQINTNCSERCQQILYSCAHQSKGTVDSCVRGRGFTWRKYPRRRINGDVVFNNTDSNQPTQPPTFCKEGSFSVWFLQYFIQHCFIFRPSDSIVSEDAGIEKRTVATSTLALTTGPFQMFNFRSCHLLGTLWPILRADTTKNVLS